MEQIVRIAHQGIPAPHHAQPGRSDDRKIDWPGPLQEESFAAERTELDKLMATRRTVGQPLGYSDQEKAHDAIDAMWRT